ncbi:MAG TPA: hypothetical protein PLE99_03885 [Candidatus Thiothrix moscowensis]|nr:MULTISPECIES: hypothetical protein [unclassified Thiothrix]HRJ51887.1 hypothetical protein [Candidatus Thiothrix moscowensis]HRJ92202.1 hypothetical protein [Candidatus Thiothrix moscowensis]
MGKPREPKQWRFRTPQTHRQGGAGVGRRCRVIRAETRTAVGR